MSDGFKPAMTQVPEKPAAGESAAEPDFDIAELETPLPSLSNALTASPDARVRAVAGQPTPDTASIAGGAAAMAAAVGGGAVAQAMLHQVQGLNQQNEPRISTGTESQDAPVLPVTSDNGETLQTPEPVEEGPQRESGEPVPTTSDTEATRQTSTLVQQTAPFETAPLEQQAPVTHTPDTASLLAAVNAVPDTADSENKIEVSPVSLAGEHGAPTQLGFEEGDARALTAAVYTPGMEAGPASPYEAAPEEDGATAALEEDPLVIPVPMTPESGEAAPDPLLPEPSVVPTPDAELPEPTADTAEEAEGSEEAVADTLPVYTPSDAPVDAPIPVPDTAEGVAPVAPVASGGEPVEDAPEWVTALEATPAAPQPAASDAAEAGRAAADALFAGGDPLAELETVPDTADIAVEGDSSALTQDEPLAEPTAEPAAEANASLPAEPEVILDYDPLVTTEEALPHEAVPEEALPEDPLTDTDPLAAASAVTITEPEPVAVEEIAVEPEPEITDSALLEMDPVVVPGDGEDTGE